MLALTLFLALLLVASAAHKAIERRRLAAATARLAGVPASLGPALLMLAATVEGLSAVALILPDLRVGGAISAAVLWSSYALTLLRRRGETLDCGCDLVAREKPVDAIAILRPALLAGLALLAAMLPTASWTIDAPFAALALLALWFAAAEIVSLPNFARAKA